jgi:hypothetical protein
MPEPNRQPPRDSDTQSAKRDTRIDLRDEGTVILPPAIPHEPTPALFEIRLPAVDAEGTRPLNETLRCPRCDMPLSERCDLGWCQRCGYCRYMEKRKIVPARVARAQHEARLRAGRGRLFPAWVGVLLCGVLVCTVSAFVAGSNIGTDARTRHAWYVAQSTVAGLLMLMGHVAAFLRLVPAGLRLRHATLLVSPRLWWGVWRRLPATQSSVWLGGWGLALALSTAALYVMAKTGFRLEDWLPFSE